MLDVTFIFRVTVPSVEVPLLPPITGTKSLQAPHRSSVPAGKELQSEWEASSTTGAPAV